MLIRSILIVLFAILLAMAVIWIGEARSQGHIPYSRMGLTQDQINACSHMFFNRPAPLPAQRNLCTELKSLTEEFCP